MTSKLSRAVVATMTIGAVFAAGASAGSVKTFKLFDHPDGANNPPPYGIRLDGIFGDSQTTTFSFDTTEGVEMRVTEFGNGTIVINISGVVFGGHDIGSNYDLAHAGTGKYELNYTYAFNVVAEGTGYRVDPQHQDNGGTFNAIDINGDEANYQFNIFEEPATGNPFKFLQDDHRLAGETEAGQGFWVGRGWHTYVQGQGVSGTQDFLFLGMQMVPLPTPWALAGVGMMTAAMARRRRN